MDTIAATVRLAVRAEARVGEGPVWDPGSGRLHWVDILAGAVHTSDLANGWTTTRVLPTLVGAVSPKRTGGLVAAVTEGFADVSDEYVVRQHVLGDGIRMNDAKCDPDGRFWAGSTAMDFAAGRGALHVLEADWSTRVVLDGLTQPNGLGWSPDGRTFYLADTAEREISAFDVFGNQLAGRRLLCSFADSDVPDGLCVDAAGCLWVALWGGGRLVRIAPDGRMLSTLRVPVVQPSSCAFVGPDLDLLCVTSACEGIEPADNAEDGTSYDGSVLIVAGLGVSGVPVAGFAG
ncbi:SMP-30/gluconolactonase/LRE family protein [Kribbella sp. NPDC049584]|uniref:SMP-30/gluconolactonase/LRE family protein n=1 Tax=Kribbella sp. NPDC049584 TaxID=3154833 RepID=UPI00341ED0F7